MSSRMRMGMGMGMDMKMMRRGGEGDEKKREVNEDEDEDDEEKSGLEELKWPLSRNQVSKLVSVPSSWTTLHVSCSFD